MRLFRLLVLTTLIAGSNHALADLISEVEDLVAPVAVPEQSTSDPMVINNRILANVNGKAISVIDLTKKMDLLFYRQFPQYASSPEARYQFYQANWRYILRELIEKELILADAEENKLPLNSGEVRQEMETLFGPNIITNLDKIGLTFDEAHQIIQGDLTLQKMLFIRVHAKVLRSVTPIEIRNYYDEYSKAHATPDVWIYQTISIRHSDSKTSSTAAEMTHHLLVDEKVPLSELLAKADSILPKKEKLVVSVSEEYRHDEKTVSPAYREVLQNIAPGTYSNPIAQPSRNTKDSVYRIFYLKESIPGGLPTYASLENKLKQELMEKMTNTESKAYVDKLKKHFDVQDLAPKDFQPFSLR